MKSPKITVLMAAFNSSAYISEAISSILSQTFQDFELLIINDGSGDNTVNIINSFKDERIRLLHNSQNKGLVYTRNRALEEARGDYIAVLDSDDVALPDRLHLQYEFMTDNLPTALCSGHAEIIDEKGALTGEKFIVPTGKHVEMHMLFGNPFIHSSAIFNTAAFRELNGYRNYAPAEDFDLFLRIAEKYPVTNIDHVLVKYRKHGDNTSISKLYAIRETETKILRDIYKRLQMDQDETFTEIHYNVFTRNYQANTLNEFLGVFHAFKQANRRSKRYPKDPFEAYLFNKWYDLITLKKAGREALPLLFKKEVFDFSYLSFKQFRRAFKQSLRAFFK
jgi:glycosyltransferase involved in cell wall biosynthesis